MRYLVAAILVFVSGTLATWQLHANWMRWEPDAAIYLRMTLEDRGMSAAAATERANTFIRTTPEGERGSRDETLYSASPPAYYVNQAALFRDRPLYPALGVLLYPWLGPHGLQVISAAAYAAAVCLIFLLISTFVPIWLSGLGALAFAVFPPALEMASYAMTDELALLLWIATLGFMAIDLARPRLSTLVAFTLCAVLLSATRPAVYLPLGAAVGAYVAAARRNSNAQPALRLLVASSALFVGYLAYTMIAHGPGLVEQLRWQYDFQRSSGAFSGTFLLWYLHAITRSAFAPLVHNVVRNGEVFVLITLCVGLLMARRSRLYGLLIGAATACGVALIANPLELVRTVVLPLMPVALFLACIGMASWSRAHTTNTDRKDLELSA